MNHSTPLSSLLAYASLAVVSIACAGGQVGEESGAVCDPVERQALGRDMTSPLGFSADQLIDEVAGSFSGSVSWADDTSSPAELTVTYAGGVIEFQDREWIGDGSQELSLGDCNDVVALEVEVTATSDDGRLAEAWTTTLLAERRDAATFWISPQGFVGSLDPASFAPSDGDVTSTVSTTLGGSSATLVIDGQVSRTDGDVATAESFDVGTLTATRD